MNNSDGSSDSSSTEGPHGLHNMNYSDDSDSSDDDSLQSREMFEGIIPESERQPNTEFANEDAANFRGISIYHYNNSVLRLRLGNLHFFHYTYQCLYDSNIYEYSSNVF